MFRHDDEAAQYEALSAYRDGELTPQEEEEVRGHLTQCPGCREILGEMERIAALLEIPEEEVPEALSGRWKTAVQRERRARRRKRWLRPAGTLAAALMIAVAGIGLLPRLSKNEAEEPQLYSMDAAVEEFAGEEAEMPNGGVSAFRMALPPGSELEKERESGAEQAEETPEAAGVPQIAAFSLEDEEVDAPAEETEKDAAFGEQNSETDEAWRVVHILAPGEGKARQVYDVIEGYALARGAVFHYEETEGVRGLVCELSDTQREELFAALENIGCTVEDGGTEGGLFFWVE